MTNSDRTSLVKCVSCEERMEFAFLPAHIAKAHVGYFPYRCLGCGLKATPDEFSMMLIHSVETRHHYTVKTRLEMERLITDTLKICVGEAADSRIKLEPIVERSAAPAEPVEISDNGGSAEEPPRKENASPAKRQAGASGKKPRQRVAKKQKRVVNIAREMRPNPPNTPKLPSAPSTSGQLSPSPARENADLSLTPTAQHPQQSQSQVEVGVAVDEESRGASPIKAGPKRRLPESKEPTSLPTPEAPAIGANVEGVQHGIFKRLFAKKLPHSATDATQHLYSAHHFWMLENFGRIYSAGDASTSPAHLEAVLRWAKVKDKSKWERMAVDHAVQRKVELAFVAL